MEVEDRIEDDLVDVKDVKFDMKVEDEGQQESYSNPYFLMDSLKAKSCKKTNPLFEMSVSVTSKVPSAERKLSNG